MNSGTLPKYIHYNIINSLILVTFYIQYENEFFILIVLQEWTHFTVAYESDECRLLHFLFVKFLLWLKKAVYYYYW